MDCVLVNGIVCTLFLDLFDVMGIKLDLDVLFFVGDIFGGVLGVVWVVLENGLFKIFLMGVMLSSVVWKYSSVSLDVYKG